MYNRHCHGYYWASYELEEIFQVDLMPCIATGSSNAGKAEFEADYENCGFYMTLGSPCNEVSFGRPTRILPEEGGNLRPLPGIDPTLSFGYRDTVPLFYDEEREGPPEWSVWLTPMSEGVIASTYLFYAVSPIFEIEITPALSAADAQATEGDDATLDFTVTLHPAAEAEVTVDYATQDGTAIAGSDYTSTSGILTFAAGETSKTVSVPITDDTAEDDGETFKLLLSNVSGAKIRDAEATGTIRNTEDNTAAGGAPTITGTPRAEETLTASTSGITDANGLTNVSWQYQWLADGADIDSATGSTYTVATGDVGKRISVRVSFNDDDENAETLTSAQTVAVAATVPTAPQSLSVATGDQDQQLEASWQAPSSNGGSAVTGYKVQWKEAADSWDTASDVSEATVTGTTHTITGLTGGVEYSVRVVAINVAGDGPASTEVAATPAGGLPQQQTAEPETEETNQAVIWSGILTVGSHTPSTQFFGMPTMIWLGYNHGSYGSFSDTPSYDSGGVGYRVYNLQATNAGDEVQLVIIPTPQQDFVLTIDEFEFSSEDAHGTDYVVFRYFNWADPGLNWSENQQVAVSLAFVETKPTLSVADGEATEGDDATLDFVITLDPAAATEVTVDYATQDGTAATGSDYTSARGTLTFSAGDTTRTVSVPVVDNADNTSNEGGKTFMLLLSNADGADIADGEGTGTILTTETNSRATGLPTISGTPQVGETLTADTSPIADEDGLNNVSYSYQWIRSDNGADTDIAGETDSTYTLVLADLGKTIKVQVTFTDDGDNDETLTSEATVAATATVPTAPLRLTLTSGSQTRELDVTWQAPSSNGGSAVTGYKVQWKESAGSWDTETGVSETTVTGTTHTITELTGGVEYSVRVIATNDVGDGPASTEARATPADSPASGEEGTETVESDSTAAWTATLAVGVSGSGSETVWGYSWFLDGMGTLGGRTYSEGDQTIEVMAVLLSNGFVAFNVRPHPTVDFVLTVDGTEFDSADASEVKSRTMISYVWATTLDWTEDDRVALSLTLKGADSAEQSEPAENTPATGLPTINGTPQVDQTLTTDTSPIDDADGLNNVSYEYQWIAGGTDIGGATGSTYTFTYGEQGQTVRVRVTFTDDEGNEESLTSIATVAVAAAPNREATGKAAINGTPQVEETLTADSANIRDEDGLTNVSYSYQWIAGGSDISGATGIAYTLTASEQGQTVQVRVTFTDDRNNSETLTSIATAAVAAAPVTLTVSVTVSAPASHDGSSEFTFEIEFSEEFSLSYVTLKSHAFNVTGGSVERAQRTDKPSNIPWRITVKPQGTGDVSIELPATTDCRAAGAICTGDGRKLSNSLSFTVSGPGQ